MKRKIILIGPPGSGKGTQALRIKEHSGLPHISSGNVLRNEVARKTELGMKISHYMDRGEIGPVELITATIISYIGKNAADGFILDGFPRTLYQANELARDHAVDAVIFIDVPADEIVKRILGRRICTGCGSIYNVDYTPPASPGICDKCSAPLIQRTDDTEETIRNRIRVYNEETAPLLQFYRDRGLLHRVNGSRGADAIDTDISAILSS